VECLLTALAFKINSLLRSLAHTVHLGLDVEVLVEKVLANNKQKIFKAT